MTNQGRLRPEIYVVEVDVDVVFGLKYGKLSFYPSRL